MQFNFALNGLLSLNMVVAFLVAFILDNTVPGSRQERGVYIWSDSKRLDTDSSSLEPYSLPAKVRRYFWWAKWVGLWSDTREVSSTYQAQPSHVNPSCDIFLLSDHHRICWNHYINFSYSYTQSQVSWGWTWESCFVHSPLILPHLRICRVWARITRCSKFSCQ